MLASSEDVANAELVDLFAGPGGLDVAATWLKIKSVGIEIDENAVATRKAAGLSTLMSDVRDWSPSDFRAATILTGGPPCQTYSVAGSGAGRRRLEAIRGLVRHMGENGPFSVDGWLGELEDERTGLVLEPLKWAMVAMAAGRPFETIVLEQVPTVLPVWQEYAEVLRSMGYFAEAQVMRAEEFGVPQTRKRAILIARLNEAVKWPEPTHRKYVRGQKGHREDGKLNWIPMGKILNIQREFVVVSNYGTGGRPDLRGRRNCDEPAYTVTGKVSRNRILDLSGNYIRHINTEDASRLQTFPLGYPWSGRDVAQQIGNAIPPRLAVHVLCAAVHGELPMAQALDEAVTGTWEQARNGDFTLVTGRPVSNGAPLALFGEPASGAPSLVG
ncbi:DNA cytosine methyltransferase [Nocardia cyriacigeorgica]|uniref:DNA cytosine methyltransferase n=1 Tax=Nocardia cyriacigeorgica TaxID=135487 RepID=UPI0018952B65|nr:DNA cytosine methyltransferase [Nocardia cyriacigeorgica]MBF6081149.1 DNA cytosine methyltransferase [Nocardia cyriacigeorgica]